MLLVFCNETYSLVLCKVTLPCFKSLTAKIQKWICYIDKTGLWMTGVHVHDSGTKALHANIVSSLLV